MDGRTARAAYTWASTLTAQDRCHCSAPAATNLRASAAPIPRAAPVTTTVRPAGSIRPSLSTVDSTGRSQRSQGLPQGLRAAALQLGSWQEREYGRVDAPFDVTRHRRPALVRGAVQD